MTHEPEHEELLERLLAGDLREETAEVRGRLEGCPTCREQLQGLRTAEARARAALALERDVLAEAHDGATQKDEDALRNALARGREAESVRRGSRRTLLVLLVAAAAVLALFALRSGRLGGAPAREHEQLLGDHLSCHVEVRDGRYHAFAWDALDGSGVTYTLVLSELEGGRAGRALSSQSGLTEPRWRPSAEQERVLPERLSMEVTALDPTGLELERGSAAVSRR